MEWVCSRTHRGAYLSLSSCTRQRAKPPRATLTTTWPREWLCMLLVSFFYSRKHHPHSYSLAKALISCAKVTTPKTPWEFLTHCSKHQWEFSSKKSTLTTGVITVAALFSVNISRYFFAFSLFCIVMSCLQYTNKLLVIWYRNCVNCIELVVKHIWKG